MSDTPIDTPQDESAKFLAVFYPEIPSGMNLLVWHKPADTEKGKLSEWFDDTEKAAARISKIDSKRDIYFGVGLSPKNYGPRKRCPQKEVAALAGLWLDLDVKGPTHDGEKLPKSINEAMTLLESVPFKPTLINNSGTGLHAYWMFKELLILGNPEAWAAAKMMVDRWAATIELHANKREWSVKGTFDLARVMRMPGTWNQCKGKHDPVPCHIIQIDTNSRYEPDDFTDFLAEDANPSTENNSASKPSAVPRSAPADDPKKLGRFKAYVIKCDDAISGNGGHANTLRAACEAFRFDLSPADRWAGMQWFNDTKTGGEKWTEAELKHKLEDAEKKVTADGEIGCRLINSVVLDKRDPLPNARQFLAQRYTHPDGPALVNSGEVFHEFNGACYGEANPTGIRQTMYRWLETKKVLVKVGDGFEEFPFQPTKGDIELTLDALRAECFIEAKAPSWLVTAEGLPNPADLLIARNGIFQLTPDGAVGYGPPTPKLFAVNALDYDLLVNASLPAAWLEFLDTLFPDDPQSIELLQEWFGYCLTCDTSQQKMLLLIGPPRSGKGTIARIIRRMLGEANVCGPTLASLSTNFGMWPLLNTMLAIVSDARLSGRSDMATIIERLLSISGEDAVTVDRKNMVPLTVNLSTRVMILTNELPRLADSSGALANRFLILPLETSFLGKEDTGLTDRLTTELPSILLWAIQGWCRLRARGCFQQSSAGEELRAEFKDLASPISAFVRECCSVGPGINVETKDLFDAWRCWCIEQGRKDHGTQQVFGRDLRAAVPGVGMRQPREGSERVRVYEGVSLKLAARATLDQFRAREQDIDNRRRGQSGQRTEASYGL